MSSNRRHSIQRCVLFPRPPTDGAKRHIIHDDQYFLLVDLVLVDERIQDGRFHVLVKVLGRDAERGKEFLLIRTLTGWGKDVNCVILGGELVLQQVFQQHRFA